MNGNSAKNFKRISIWAGILNEAKLKSSFSEIDVAVTQILIDSTDQMALLPAAIPFIPNRVHRYEPTP